VPVLFKYGVLNTDRLQVGEDGLHGSVNHAIVCVPPV
jgi:hypothetical protein